MTVGRQPSQSVSTVRTNKADTAFGPVETYKTPCFSGGELGLSGGDFGRVDVGLQCLNESLKIEDYVTQSMTALQLRPAKVVIKNTIGLPITFKVSDVGDAVAGTTVTVAGKKAKTNSKGLAKISFPKGMKTGRYTVTATAPNYFAARATLVVES